MADHDKVMAFIRLQEQAPFQVEREKSALIIVDVERYFTQAEYAFGQLFEALQPGINDGYFKRVGATVLPNISQLQRIFRSMALPVIYTATGSYFENGRDLPPFMQASDHVARAVIGSRVYPTMNDRAWEVDEQIAPTADERVINKNSVDPFLSTSLDQILRQSGTRSVFVAGLLTDLCVSATARGCADRGYQVVVVGDACTTLSEELHDAALATFGLVFGRVLQTEQVGRLFTS